MKKPLTISIIILITLVIGFTLWTIFSRDSNTTVGEAVRNVLPFGSGGDVNIPIQNNNNELDSSKFFDAKGVPTEKLFTLSRTPIAGYVVFNKDGDNVVRYIDRATGHIYDSILPKNLGTDPVETKKITNNTIPKIYEAYFNPNGSKVLIRSLIENTDAVENISLSLTPPKTTASTSTSESDSLYSISSTNIRGNISSVAVVGNSLLSLVKDSSSIISSSFDGSNQKTILNTPFTDWKIISNGNNVLAQTKAGSYFSGYAYKLNTVSGSLTKIVGPLDGLIILPNPTGSFVLYSYNQGGEVKVIAKNTQNNKLTPITPATLAEKCVWSTKNIEILICSSPIEGLDLNEPDNWYKGLTHFSDRLWIYDVNENISQVLLEPKLAYDIDIDAINLQLSPDEEYLIFTNKTDLTLWALKIETQI
ncbi:hypothetical protein GW944_00280 [Candidatus Parcubacteria bacterium]|nr:hypothetical protein [Candidatus Parcubacteria bacterium]